jgi:tetratricopeptide (TPR) repeat protein
LALSDYSKALSIFDKHKAARLGRAKTYVELKRYKEAIEDYNLLTDTSEFSVYDFYYRGIANLNNGNKSNACKDWKLISNVSEEAREMINKHCKRK